MQIWDANFHGKTIESTEDDGESRLVLRFTDGTSGVITTCSCCGLWGGMVANLATAKEATPHVELRATSDS